MYICKYCKKEFESGEKLGGHVTYCLNNPNREKNLQKLNNARQHIDYVNRNNIKYICQYCGKEVGNKGCLILHEKYCKENPNQIISKTRKKVLKRKEIKERKKRNYNGFPSPNKGKKMSPEFCKKVSEGRKRYLREHKDEHVWKRHSKFISIPCQNLKNKLKELNISFIEELTPFDDYNYSIDIAWPDIKVGIEVNGNQHYKKDGTLVEYYQNRHNIFESRGWKLFEIHYSKCYNININDFNDILSLDIYDKEYVKEIFDKKLIKEKNKEINKKLHKEEILNKQIEKHNFYKDAIISLINESKIDFSKFGWVKYTQDYLNKKFNILLKGNISRFIKEYYPDFFNITNAFIRK